MESFDDLVYHVSKHGMMGGARAARALKNGDVTINGKAVGVNEVGTSLNDGDLMRIDSALAPSVYGPFQYSTADREFRRPEAEKTKAPSEKERATVRLVPAGGQITGATYTGMHVQLPIIDEDSVDVGSLFLFDDAEYEDEDTQLVLRGLTVVSGSLVQSVTLRDQTIDSFLDEG